MANLGDFLNSLNYNKNDVFLTDPTADKDYVPFIINRGLSLFEDTVFIANELNRMHNVPKHNQYRFALNTIRPRKRFTKWPKKINDSKINLIKKHFNYNNMQAEAVADLLNDEQIQLIESLYYEGGRT